MSGQPFISLLNPAIDLAFAAVFLLLWLNRRERYVAYAALAYLATALAFLILDVAPALPMELQRLPANMGFLAAAMFLAAAIIRRYGLPVPWRAMMAVAGVSLAFFTWHLLVDPGIAARIYSISAGAGAIALMIVHALRPVDKPHLIDRVLFWVSVLTAVDWPHSVLPLSLLAAVCTALSFQRAPSRSPTTFSGDSTPLANLPASSRIAEASSSFTSSYPGSPPTASRPASSWRA